MTVPTTIATTLPSMTTSKNFTEKTTTLQTDHTPGFTGNTSVTTESSVSTTTKITILPPTPIPTLPPTPIPTPIPSGTPNWIPTTTNATDGIITDPSTQSTTSMRSTTMPMQSTSQCVSNVTYSSPTTASSYSTTTDAIEITTTKNITPIISTTFVTNPTVLTPSPQLPADTTSTFSSPMPPVTTKTTSTTTITSKTNVTEKTTSTDINVNDPSTTEENTSKITPIFNYILRDDTGVACVLANMTIHVNLQYTTKDFQILPMVESMLTVPTDATTTGICLGKTANMTLSWEEPIKGYNNKKNKITFNYSHDNSKFFLDSIFVELHEKKTIGNATIRHQLFSAAIKDGIFICETSTTINVENKINVDISDIYLIVFNECFNNCRKTVTDCIAKTVIKTIVIIGIIIVGIVLNVVLYVLYSLWYVQRKK
ncbi:hypothetical protein ALC57_12481 [Trachymyrmex cornetzi]|uniref:Lysosome-associated membrane glycoprotein 2-like luminal domain-containing protein n=1 Tax=Trachymyrmex cornetzi TaxID=471704 RepID=A0A195DRJ7_9HYME|nr:hypothetical protein ALC57_12481 [Trachymyrmex cornetzi]